MAYKITCDGFPILDLRANSLIVEEPVFNLEVNKVGEGSFTIYNDHPHFDKLKRMKSIIEVLDDEGAIFRGRMTDDTMDFYNGKAVDLEGAMAFFNDSIVRPFVFPDDFLENADYITAAESGNVVKFFLKWLIDGHNEQVTKAQRFKLGKVTVTDPNNYITRSNSSYDTTWANLDSRLFNSSLGGYLCIRYEADGNYIDYLAEFKETNQQEIMFGENLLDITNETTATEAYSAIIPLGKKSNGDDLTIGDVPDSDITADVVKKGDTIYSKKAVEEFGWVCRVVAWEDVTGADNLVSKAVEKLTTDGIMLSNTIEAQAVDLHLSDSAIQSFRINKLVRVYSKPHGLAEKYPLLKLSIPLLKPQNTTITVGKTRKTLLDQQTASKNDLKNQIIVTQTTLEKDVSDVRTEVTVIQGSVEEVKGNIDEIRGDFGELSVGLSGVQEDVEGVKQDIEAIRGDVSDVRDEISGAKDSISGIQGEMSDAQTDLEQLRKDLTETQEEGEALANRLSTAEGDISLLKQDAEEFSVSMTNAQGDISQLKQTADEISARVADNEGNISELQQTAEGFRTTVSGMQGDISVLQQTDTEIKASVANAEGDISVLQQTATEIQASIANAEGDISTLQQSATEIKAAVENAEGDISELQQAAEGFSTTVGNMQDEISQIKQTAGEVRVVVANGDGALSSIINPEMVSIARTDKNGNITSGFFFDADDGEFKFYGSGEFRSSTGSAFYTRVEGNEIVLYNGFDDKIHIGVQEGVDPDGNVFDYSYIVMGEDAHDNIGLIKKFYNGLWYGNAVPRYLTGNFQAMSGASGLFVNTQENKVYVVNGTEMQNVYTGEAVARFA